LPGVLVVVVLYWAQAVLVPIALAILLTFVLTPPVTWVERWIGRIPAVLAMVTLVFTVLGLAGWSLARQMDHLAEDLPRYRVNILAKIADVRGAGKGGSVEKLQDTIDDIKTDLGKSEVPRGTIARPVVVTSVAGLRTWPPRRVHVRASRETGSRGRVSTCGHRFGVASCTLVVCPDD
jgi:predicted PurR-regulated permease PerM